MGNPIGMRGGLLKPKLRMKVVVFSCWFHVLSVSFSGFYGYKSAMNSFYDDCYERFLMISISMDHFCGDGLNETKSDLGGPP